MARRQIIETWVPPEDLLPDSGLVANVSAMLTEAQVREGVAFLTRDLEDEVTKRHAMGWEAEGDIEFGIHGRTIVATQIVRRLN